MSATTAFRATPGRLLIVVFGVPLMLAGIGWGAFSLVGVLARTSEHHHVAYAWSGGSVSLDVGSGSAEIRSADTRAVTVDYTEHYELKRPRVVASTTSGGLALRGSCAAGILGQNCEINYVITVPRQAVLQVHVGDGSLTLQGISTQVVARVGNGSLHGTQLGSRHVTATIGDGSIRLQWAMAPASVNASAGNGSIDVTVPQGSGPYAIRQSGLGSSDIGVATDPGATATMLLHAGDGSVHVRYGN